MTTSETFADITDYAVCIGIDWASETHAVCLEIPGAAKREPLTLANTPEAIHQWLGELRGGVAGRRVAIALEKSRTLLVEILLQAGFVDLYLIAPSSVADYRKAFTPSRAKSDPTDAELILDLLVRHHEQLTCWRPDDPLTRELRGLTEERRQAVNHKVKLCERLKAKLNRYFPQAAALAGELDTTMACDFLLKWADPAALTRSHDHTLRRFYYAHNARSETLIEQRLAIKHALTPATSDRALIAPLVITVHALARQIRVALAAIKAFDQAISTCLAQHPDTPIFASFPGAGAALTPRLIAAFGTDRERYPDASSIQCCAGTAPVTETSGKKTWVHWRWHRPVFTYQTFHEYAGSSVRFSAWAKAYVRYRQDKDKNANYQSILRALAFKWMRVMHACWRNRTTYDEDAYIQTLRKRHSPLCHYLDDAA